MCPTRLVGTKSFVRGTKWCRTIVVLLSVQQFLREEEASVVRPHCEVVDAPDLAVEDVIERDEAVNEHELKPEAARRR